MTVTASWDRFLEAAIRAYKECAAVWLDIRFCGYYIHCSFLYKVRYYYYNVVSIGVNLQ